MPRTETKVPQNAELSSDPDYRQARCLRSGTGHGNTFAGEPGVSAKDAGTASRVAGSKGGPARPKAGR